MEAPDNVKEPKESTLSQSEQTELLEAERKKEIERRHEEDAKAHQAANEAKRAWKEAKRKDPKRLGFLRVIEVAMGFTIVGTLVMLVMTSRDTQVYDLETAISWIKLVGYALVLFLLMGRFKIARPVSVTLFCIIIACDVGVCISTGNATLPSIFGRNIGNILLAVYFGTSQRITNICVNPLSMSTVRVRREEFKIQRKGWPFIRNLIIYFCVFSVLGHWMEAAMCQLIRLGIVQGEVDLNNTMLWRDWFYPFPMEGMAVVLIAVLLYPLKEWLVKKMPSKILAYAISFVANAITCSIIEFSMGLIVNSHFELWNYSDMPFNIMGQVCLQNALAFGAAASIIAWIVYPLLEYGISLVPRDIMNIIFVVIVAGYSILQALYLISPPIDPSKYNYTDQAILTAKYEEDTREMADKMEDCESALKDIDYMKDAHQKAQDARTRLEEFNTYANTKFSEQIGIPVSDEIGVAAALSEGNERATNNGVDIDSIIERIADGTVPREDWDKVLTMQDKDLPESQAPAPAPQADAA